MDKGIRSPHPQGMIESNYWDELTVLLVGHDCELLPVIGIIQVCVSCFLYEGKSLVASWPPTSAPEHSSLAAVSCYQLAALH